MISDAYISMGSNTIGKYQIVKFGISELAKLGQHIIYSENYITVPQGFNFQPDFLNVVCLVKTHLSAFEFLFELNNIERAANRKRVFRNSPRTLDLDILLFGSQVMKTKHLELPHPRMLERKFVLEPLSEINPFLVIPNQNLTVKEILLNMS